MKIFYHGRRETETAPALRIDSMRHSAGAHETLELLDAEQSKAEQRRAKLYAAKWWIRLTKALM